MEWEDALIYVFLISFIATAAEFLFFGVLKLIELFYANLTYFLISLIFPIIALASFLILIFKI